MTSNIEPYRAEILNKIDEGRFSVLLQGQRLMLLDLKDEQRTQSVEGVIDDSSSVEVQSGDKLIVELSSNDRLVSWRLLNAKNNKQ